MKRNEASSNLQKGEEGFTLEEDSEFYLEHLRKYAAIATARNC